jgi:hypothetical protein
MIGWFRRTNISNSHSGIGSKWISLLGHKPMNCSRVQIKLKSTSWWKSGQDKGQAVL